MAKLRILIADDHALLREGLVMLIAREADMEVVAQADNGSDAVRLAQEAQPDVAVLDVSMPQLGGAEAAEQIRASCPKTHVVALTRHGDQAYLRRLLRAGATGYVLKKSAAQRLIDAIRTVAGGATYLEPELATSLVERTLVAGPTRPGEREPLTMREEQVLQAVAWGRSSKEIAQELALSIKTVESYRATATQKLGLRNRAEIVRYAVGRGWLSGESAPE